MLPNEYKKCTSILVWGNGWYAQPLMFLVLMLLVLVLLVLVHLTLVLLVLMGSVTYSEKLWIKSGLLDA